MARKGLSSEKIYKEALALVIEKGYDNFSLRELAARLDVKPSSLYNHVHGIGEISTAVGMISIAHFSDALNKAVRNKECDDAFISFAHAYRKFAIQNPELYRAIIAIPTTDDAALLKNEQETIAPLRKVVELFIEDEKDVVNFQRFVRSAMHGFITLEAAGFMRYPGISHDESYDMLINACLNELKSAAHK